jgi:hypothetical protein
MEKTKLQLSELKVTSFIAETDKVRAGAEAFRGISPDSPYCVQTWDNNCIIP